MTTLNVALYTDMSLANKGKRVYRHLSAAVYLNTLGTIQQVVGMPFGVSFQTAEQFERDIVS